MKKVFIFCLIAIASSWANPLPPSGAPQPSQPDIKIQAEQMDCDQSQNKCIARGNAIAEKLNDPKTKVLKADQITVYFAKEGGKGTLKATRLDAEGHVFFLIGDMVIQGKRGSYLADSAVAEVFDDVKITNGGNQVDGGYGKVNMKTGQYTIRQDGARVQALIFAKETPPNGIERPKKEP